jgi:subtilisin family serine protease
MRYIKMAGGFFCLCTLIFVHMQYLDLWAGINKLDPRLEIMAAHPERFAALEKSGKILRKDAKGYWVETLVTFDGDPSQIKQCGASLRCVWDDLAIVHIFLNLLSDLSDLDCVRYVEANRTVHLSLDVSVPAIAVPQVREDFDLTGKGVIIGIIDSGIDWQHEDFISPDGTTRIKSILDLSEPGDVYGGTVYTEEDINLALNGIGNVSQQDLVGHGTHVAGIAAGDGTNGSGFGTYAGVAPEADLVVVKATHSIDATDFTTSNQIVAMKFIDSVATALGMPYVMNLSFGGHDGAHDGTATAERKIDELIGLGRHGKAIVTVAGNEGDEDIHASGEFKRGVNSITAALVIVPYSPTSVIGDDVVQMVAWYDGDSHTSVSIESPNGLSYGPVAPGSYIERSGSDGEVYLWNGFYEKGDGYLPGANPFNGDKEVFIQIGEHSVVPPAAGTWKIIFQGSKGRFDVWLAYASMATHFLNQVDNSSKVSIPGTAQNVITVGAYITKRTWYDLDGNHLTFDSNNELSVGQLARFSNSGPTRDGRIKPEITAPGQMIGSTYSTYAPPTSSASIYTNANYPNAFILPDERHAVHQGTSMAAPHVTGVVALLLQKYPELTANQIKQIIQQSARRDVYTGSMPSDTWGYGKVNAFAALQINPEEEPPIDFKLVQGYPNPFTNKTTIMYELPVGSYAVPTSIKIYNSIGQLVRVLVSGDQWGGKQIAFWDGRDDNGNPLASGVYFCRFQSGRYNEMFKLAFLRSGQ